MTVVSLPSRYFDAERVSALLPDDVPARLVSWDLHGEPDGAAPAELDIVVTPFHTTSPTPNPGYAGIADLAAALPRATSARLVQLPSVGAEGVAELVPPRAVLANAAGAMEGQTAELAVTLLLSSLRDLPGFAASAPEWRNRTTPGLLGQHVVLLGYGGIGRRIASRLDGFEARVTRVARTARRADDGEEVIGTDALIRHLADAAALVCSLPLSPDTRGLIDAEVLSALPDGAVVVNVGRGPVVDTAALLAELESGRLRAALDVTDPEPLPADHPLWRAPHTIITPHVGGNSAAMPVLLHRLVADQIARVARGERPHNIIREAGA